MKNSQQNLTKILVLSLALGLLSACAGNRNQSGGSELASRLPVSTNNSPAKPLAFCSQGKGQDMSMKLKVYTDGTNNTRLDFVYVRMTQVPANFTTSKNYIAMWKWLSNTSGYTYLDSTPLQFLLVDPTTGKNLTGWKTKMTWEDVSNVASGMSITDPQTFFAKVNILVDLKDAQGEYDVLKITTYDSTSNKAVSQTDGLLPLYYANPVDYAVEANGSARADVLQSLHPFFNNRNQGFTSTQFQSMANDFCF